MRKNKKGLLMFLIIVMIMASLLLLNGDFGKVPEEKNKIIDSETNEMVTYLLENDSFLYDKNIINSWTIKRVNETERNINNDYLCRINFIDGSVNLFNSKYDEAIKNFQNCISHFDKNTELKLQARVYYELSKVYIYVNKYDESDETYKKAEELYKNERDKEYLISLYIWRHYDVSQIPGGTEKAIDVLTKALEIAKLNKSKQLSKVYYKLGSMYGTAGRAIEAIEYKIEAINTAAESKDINQLMLVTTEIGIDYLVYDNYEEGIRYLEEALQYTLDDEEMDAESRGYALSNLASAYLKLGDYENAEKNLKLFYEFINKEKDGEKKKSDLIIYKSTKAELMLMLGEYSEALELLNEAKDSYENSTYFSYYNFDITLAYLYGDIYYEMGQYEEALKYHKYVEKLVNERNIAYLHEDNNDKLNKDYVALGDYKSAYQYSEANNQLNKEKIRNSESQYASFLLEKFQNDKKQEEIINLEKMNSNLRITFILLFFIILIIAMAILFIAKKNREISRLNELFKKLSITDGLTKIPNRRAFDEKLDLNWQRYKEEKLPISFVMIDIDCFKKYNDTYGHQKGDRVLEIIAAELKNICGETDFVARYGGEEFVIIMLETNKDQAIEKLEKIKAAIYNLNIEHSESSVSDRVTLSMGSSTVDYKDEGKDYSYYIKLADDALYKAKLKRNCYCHNHPEGLENW